MDAILVVERQDSARESLAELLRGEGYEVYAAVDGSAAIPLVDQVDLDLALTDLRMGGSDGKAVLRHLRDVSPQTLVILMTAHEFVETAIEAIRLGAVDYILKPLIFEDVLRKVQHFLAHRKLGWENQILREKLSQHASPDQPFGRSEVIQEILALITKVAPTPTTVLITGESGVGKESRRRSNDSCQQPCEG